MAESQSPLALAGEDDDTDQTMAGSDDYAPGTFSGSGGLGALDVPGAAQALALMSKSSQQARAALQSAREKIAARKYDRSLPWFALSSALSKPTRTGAIGEVFGNVSDALAPTVRERAAFKANQEKELLGLDTQIAGLDQNAATAQLQLAALQAKLAAQGANASNDRVIGADGTVRYASHASARGQPAWTPPANSTNVSMNTEKSLYGTMGDKLAEQYVNQYMIAQKAPGAIERTRALKELLKTKPYTGAGANFKLAFGKAAKAFGFDYAGDDIQNTELLASRLGQEALDNVKSSGLAGSQGLTEGERRFLLQVVGGTITLDEHSIARLADIHERTARDAVSMWNSTYSRLKKPMLDELGLTRVDLDTPSKQKASAPAEEAPAAASPPGAPYGLAPAQWAVDPANPPPRAPPDREAMLKQKPELRQQFLDYYGYLPQ